MKAFHQHLGLGDHLVCCGLIRTLHARNRKPFTLFCNHVNVEPVRQMYADLPCELHAVKGYEEAQAAYGNYDEVRRIGLDELEAHQWEYLFYHQQGIDYGHRWSHFKIAHRNRKAEEALFQRVSPPQRYALLCDTSSMGRSSIRPATRLPVIRLTRLTENLFDWITLIERATEIHSVDTSFYHLVRHLPVTQPRFFYPHRKTHVTIDDAWDVVHS